MTRRPNRLLGQTSPYLLQHAHNPVDWHPWGPEAVARAREFDRPIFLSVGYAACHWCHVMERESFENERIAAFLNERFVSIKVDREERPDLDEIYMTAVQLMAGQGGWPMTVFLTPDLEPFFGGTYFPPETRLGRIGFLDLLSRIAEAWDARRDAVVASAAEMAAALRRVADGPPGARTVPGRDLADRAVSELAVRFDPDWGGFGSAPKFPADQAIALLLRSGDPAARAMAVRTLDRMARGGLYDHVGGGFARYSVDDRWLVPHFEKMLYNQALLVPAYVDAWRITGSTRFARVARETTEFVRRELTDADGGVHSSLDADSEGVEGRFYVWTPAEVREALDDADDADWFCRNFDVTARGNFEGRSIPNRIAMADRGGDDEDDAFSTRLASVRARLLEVRDRRVRPATDDKVLASWNGLMITGFCRAAQAWNDPRDVASARRSAAFVLDRMIVDGRLRASWRAGRACWNAYLDDHAFLARGLVDLFETTFERRWLDAAERLVATLLARFEDRDRGGFYFVSDDHETLLARTRPAHDGALPAGSAVAAEALSRLGRHLDRPDLREAARRTLAALAGSVDRAPAAHAATLLAAEWERDRVLEIAVVGDPEDSRHRALLDAARRAVGPLRVVVAGRGADDRASPLLRDRPLPPDGPCAYVCRDSVCEAPVSDPAALARRLAGDGGDAGSPAQFPSNPDTGR